MRKGAQSASSASKARAAFDTIPSDQAQRHRLREAAREYISSRGLSRPLSVEQLRRHAARIARQAGASGDFRDFIGLLLHNELWKDALATVPYQRRLLLLPQCLRAKAEPRSSAGAGGDGCEGTIDEFGLVCRRCGRCPIGAFQSRAEELGYVVLVADGSAVVTSLIQAGKIDAIVGVSCLSVLKRMFPYMEIAGIPGIAVPLLRDGCADTVVDLDSVWEAVYLDGIRKPVFPQGPGALKAQAGENDMPCFDLDALRAEVAAWFELPDLAEAMGPAAGSTEAIARDWLGRSGKRWRPFLVACTYRALWNGSAEPLPSDLRKLALAVECFHKASLVHDDIEDNDPLRYGQPTLHQEHGLPVALNVGDFLIGEGYRMISQAAAPAERKARMLATAVGGHRNLCIGQGEELCWAGARRPLSVAEVLNIFRLKTAPSFEVALHLGAIAAGGEPGLLEVLSDFSQSLGTAYQIRDDLEDLIADGGDGDGKAMRPSVLLAIAYERSSGAARTVLETLWRRSTGLPSARKKVLPILQDLGVHQAGRQMLESYKDQAVAALEPLGAGQLKALLRRVVAKIFLPLPSVGAGWCQAAASASAGLGELSHDHPPGDAASGELGAESAA